MSGASHEIKGSVDFNQKELRNARFQRLLTPPISPQPGQIYHNSVNEIPYYWNSTEWNPFGIRPVHKRYADQTELLDDQLLQITGYIYYNEELNIYYEKLSTNTEDIDVDYNPIGGSGLNNNEVKVIYVNPAFLSGTGTIEEQICEYINDNIIIDYSRQYSKLNIVLEDAVPQKTIINGFLYNYYAENDTRKITSSDDWVVSDTRTHWDDLREFIEPGFINGSNSTGGPLKSTSVDDWDAPNTGATNIYGFNAIGSGSRNIFGSGFSGLKTDFICGTGGTGEIYMNNTSASSVLGGGFTLRYGIAVRLVRTSTTLADGETGLYVGNDGQIYPTVCINGVEWTTKNLAETKYRNGDDIPEVTDDTTWNSLTTGARCSYNNDEANAFIAP